MRSPFPVLFLSGCLAALVGCGSGVPAAAKKRKLDEGPLRTETLTVQPQSWPRIVRAQGTLVADEVAVVGARVDGRVDQVHVDLGAEVQTGFPLATLDQQLPKLQVAQAEAQLNQARSALGMKPDDSVDELDPRKSPNVRQQEVLLKETEAVFDRAEVLNVQNAITQREYEQAEFAKGVAQARYESALNGAMEKIALIRVREAELALARERLIDTVILAPFGGQIQRRQAAPGMYLRTGDPVATLVRTHPLRFRGAMPERRAHRLVVGQEIRLQIESVNEPRVVTITRISPALDPRSRALVFEADIQNQDHRLRTGLFAEARVVVDPDARAVVVPRSAVVEFAGAEKVWKVVDGQAAEQEILIGERRGDRYEVLQGLAAGDVILPHAAVGRAAKVLPVEAGETAPETVVGTPDPAATSE